MTMLTRNPPTEILVDLREAIQQLGRHFQSVDPEVSGVSLLPDYSMESHARDHDAFVSVSSKKQRRAKALLGESALSRTPSVAAPRAGAVTAENA